LRAVLDGLERKVAERTRDLDAAKHRAEDADRLKSAFLATMSHELRTPLNSIIGFTGIILQGLAGPLVPEQTRQLGMVRESARHLLALINDVLDISKIESGQLEIRTAPFDLHDSIRRVSESVRPLAEKKEIALRVAIPKPPLPLESDQRRVEQILINLLSNAIKFTDRGEVILSLEVDQTRQVVRLLVSDTGIGIKEEDIQRLFQPFRQIDSGLQRVHEGTGLGLAICRRLTDLLGGEIEVMSTWGRGSLFTVTLPLRPDAVS
jgi:signal transduction histidine kinase